MGVRSGVELSQNVVAKTFTNVNVPAAPTDASAADAFKPTVDMRSAKAGWFNFTIMSLGGGTTTVIVEKTYDGGTNWIAAVDENRNAVTLSAVGSFRLREVEQGVSYRMRCTAHNAAGTGVLARLSQ